ncbi:MAG: T9SS type A sorting domain-containing protein [Bacteroidetes bacterium]|nr:T9SS type A sorting domain-containing protein [Bacteroidota bacterium]
MKSISLSVLALFIAVISLSQTTITFKNNALLTGDINSSQEIQYVLPGDSGPNQIWDFSKIQFTGTTSQSSVTPVPSKTLNSFNASNVVLKESDKDYYFTITDALFEENGYISKDITLNYSDPVLKMKYPFSYGDQFTDRWAGSALFQNVTKIDLSGDFSVSADAYGTLILPNQVLKNTLRVRTEKNSVEINPCSTVESQTIRYFWYAQQYRYPVLIITTTQVKTSGKDSGITRSASVNLEQPLNGEVISGVTDTQVSPDNSDVSVIIYPNPFTEKLTYNYFLRKELPVTLDLYDMTGRLSRRLIQTQVQPEGLHSGVLHSDEVGMSPGIYYLRFTFDHKVSISKVVKM